MVFRIYILGSCSQLCSPCSFLAAGMLSVNQVALGPYRWEGPPGRGEPGGWICPQGPETWPVGTDEATVKPEGRQLIGLSSETLLWVVNTESLVSLAGPEAPPGSRLQGQ